MRLRGWEENIVADLKRIRYVIPCQTGKLGKCVFDVKKDSGNKTDNGSINSFEDLVYRDHVVDRIIK